MKNLLQHFTRVFGILFLTALCLHSFSQVRSLKALSDTIDLVPGIPVVYNILANDTIPADDTLRRVDLFGSGVLCQKIHGATWVFTFTYPSWGHGGEILGLYRLFTMALDTSSARILFRIHDNSFSYLDINNVRARFNASGIHFFHENADFEVPKGSGKRTSSL